MSENQDVRIPADEDATPAGETEAVAAPADAGPGDGIDAGAGAGAAAPAEAEAASVDPAAVEPPSRKRRISNGTLFTAALAIGVLGGVGTGYAVQATRPATPLPPLSATQPKYAPVGVYQGIAPAPLPASQDDATLTEGDLASLLLPRPAGASSTEGGWVDQDLGIVDDAELCTDQSSCFNTELGNGVDAVADTSWMTDGFTVEIRLLRYAPGDSDQATQKVLNAPGGSGETDIPLPTGIEASGYEYRDSYDQNADQAFAVHGDIVAVFWVTSPTKVPNPSLIDGVIKQQMGRF